ncbi:MAG: NADH-quinone oxidoreductase subunit A [Chthoniobacterales bacterium]
MLTEQYLPLALHVVVALGLAASIFVASLLLGRVGKRTADKDMAYECGMPVREAAAPRFSVKFYLVAMLFILFDIEVVFMYPWAVVYRDFLAQQGSIIFWSMTGFVTVLTVGYIYAIKKGALDWRN